MNDKQNLWEILTRLDTFVNTTNFKSAVVLAFNTFILSGIIIQFEELTKQIGTCHPTLKLIGSIIIVCIVVISLISVIFVLLVIKPFLESHTNPNDKSVIYFGDIANNSSAENFIDAVKQKDDNNYNKDIGEQIYSISDGLKRKYRRMKWAINLIIFGSIPLAFIYLLIVIFSKIL